MSLPRNTSSRTIKWRSSTNCCKYTAKIITSTTFAPPSTASHRWTHRKNTLKIQLGPSWPYSGPAITTKLELIYWPSSHRSTLPFASTPIWCFWRRPSRRRTWKTLMLCSSWWSPVKMRVPLQRWCCSCTVWRSSTADWPAEISANYCTKYSWEFPPYKVRPIWAKAISQCSSWPSPKACSSLETSKIVHSTSLRPFSKRLNTATPQNWRKSWRQTCSSVC